MALLPSSSRCTAGRAAARRGPDRGRGADTTADLREPPRARQNVLEDDPEIVHTQERRVPAPELTDRRGAGDDLDALEAAPPDRVAVDNAHLEAFDVARDLREPTPHGAFGRAGEARGGGDDAGLEPSRPERGG